MKDVAPVSGSFKAHSISIARNEFTDICAFTVLMFMQASVLVRVIAQLKWGTNCYNCSGKIERAFGSNDEGL